MIERKLEALKVVADKYNSTELRQHVATMFRLTGNVKSAADIKGIDLSGVKAADASISVPLYDLAVTLELAALLCVKYIPIEELNDAVDLMEMTITMDASKASGAKH